MTSRFSWRWSVLAAAIVALAGVCSPTRGSVILSNLPGSGTYSGGDQPLTTSTWEAVGLTTGSSAATFTSMSGYFLSAGGGTIDGGIYSNSSNSPGSLLAAFNSVSVAGASGTPEETLTTTTSNYALQASTEYWFVLHDFVPFSWVKDTANSDVGTIPTASGGATFDGYTNSTNTGSTWSTPSLTTGNYTVSIADVVPEPASLGLLSVGGLLLACRLRK